MYTQSSESGFSVLESLICLVIMGTIFGMTVPAILNANKRFQNDFDNAVLVGRAQQIAAIYKRAFQQTGGIHALSDVKLHARGEILAKDEKPIVFTSKDRKPDPDSQALSIVTFSSSGISDFHRISFSEGALCYDSAIVSELHPTTLENWLGISPFGAIVLTTKLKTFSSSGTCAGRRSYRGSFAADEGTPFENSELRNNRLPTNLQTLLSAKTIISSLERVVPISESYTLYVDRTHTLRRLSHTSRDNQPIAYDVEEVTFTEQSESSGTSYILTVNLLNSKLAPQEFRFPFFVTNDDAANFLSLAL